MNKAKQIEFVSIDVHMECATSNKVSKLLVKNPSFGTTFCLSGE